MAFKDYSDKQGIIHRDLDSMKKIVSNENYDFYIRQMPSTKEWYAFAIKGSTDIHSNMAGFKTKKAAIECINKWVEWMK